MTNLAWKRLVLPNGLRMLLFPRPGSMTAQLSVAVAYGSNSESEDTAGMAHFLEHMIAGGSTQRIGLSQSVEQMGGYIDFSTANEDTMIITDVMPDKLEETSKTLTELLFSSGFEEEKFYMRLRKPKMTRGR
jgi:predicted Zn-dependent peptidase